MLLFRNGGQKHATNKSNTTGVTYGARKSCPSEVSEYLLYDLLFLL